MNIALYVLAGWVAFGTLLAVSQVGKDRKPLEPRAAVIERESGARVTYECSWPHDGPRLSLATAGIPPNDTTVFGLTLGAPAGNFRLERQGPPLAEGEGHAGS